MKSHPWIQRGLRACLLAVLPALAATPPAFVDPLDTPSTRSPLASHGLINGLANAGHRIVGVGQRGHIVYSDDEGQHWLQAEVPVSSDLLAVRFVTALQGWAVGHDGVVLHSADGGATWNRQLDGRAMEQGMDKAFLDVCFEDSQHGYAVGAFNLVYRSDDGGRNWRPWSGHADNPNGYHLNAIRIVGGDLYVAGEQGLLLRLNRDSQRFEAVPTPYRGSYFGLVGQAQGPAQALVLYGLRGNAWRSTDHGRSWKKVATGLQVGLTAGVVTADGRMVLVSQAGHVLVSKDGGASFGPAPQPMPGPVSAVAESGGLLVLGGARGLRVQALGAR